MLDTKTNTQAFSATSRQRTTHFSQRASSHSLSSRMFLSVCMCFAILWMPSLRAQNTTTPAPAAATTTTTPALPAAATATPADTGTSTATTTAAPITDAEYQVKIKDLNNSVNELKEQIFRSKSKLTLLAQEVISGSAAGSGLVIVHNNQMGDVLSLIEVRYFLDGAPLWQPPPDEAGSTLTSLKEHIVWDGNIVEGTHTLSVQMVYRGNGNGVFSYLRGYTFRLKDSITFSAEPGKKVKIRAIGYEKGDFTTELTERPAIRFEREVQNNIVTNPVNAPNAGGNTTTGTTGNGKNNK